MPLVLSNHVLRQHYVPPFLLFLAAAAAATLIAATSSETDGNENILYTGVDDLMLNGACGDECQLCADVEETESRLLDFQLLQRGATKISNRLASELSGVDVERPLLFSWMFGAQEYERPNLQLFLRSAAASSTDIVFIGEPAPPRSLVLPSNVWHVRVDWDELASRLEHHFPEARPLAEFRAAELNKTTDIRPLSGLLFPEIVGSRAWWGWVESDLWLGDIQNLLASQLSNPAADFISAYGEFGFVIGDLPLDCLYAKTLRVKTYGPSHGPFSLVRNSQKMNSLLTRNANRDIVVRMLRTKNSIRFEEWGEPAWEGLGFNYSYSALLNASANSGEIVMLGMGNYKGSTVGVQADSECYSNSLLGMDTSMCSYCSMTTSALDENTCYATEIGSNKVRTLNGTELVYCHFQWAKKEPAHANMSQAYVQSLLCEPSVASSYSLGFYPEAARI